MKSSVPVLLCFCTLCSVVAAEVPPASSTLPSLKKPTSFVLRDHTAVHQGENVLPIVKETRYLEGEEEFIEEEQHDDEEHHDNESRPKPVGAVIGATLLVNLATILGVVFLIPMCRQKTTAKGVLDFIIPAFASGTLIATALFLTLPESISYIHTAITALGLTDSHEDHGDEEEDNHDNHRFLEGEEHEEEHHDDEHGFELPPATVWRVAVSVLVGFLLPKMVGIMFPKAGTIIEEEDAKVVTNAPNKEDFDPEDFDNEESTAEVSDNASIISVDKSLVLAVLFGDSLCNFCDGVFIGIAVSLCNSSIAWAVIGVTLYHEVAQELADYFLLTKIAGLTPFKALTLNFVTGLSVLVGGLLTLVLDMSDMVIGVLLGLASGVYIYISTCECLPRVDKYLVSYKERLIFFAMFALGAIPLGLTLLGHVHCDA